MGNFRTSCLVSSRPPHLGALRITQRLALTLTLVLSPRGRELSGSAVWRDFCGRISWLAKAPWLGALTADDKTTNNGDV